MSVFRHRLPLLAALGLAPFWAAAAPATAELGQGKSECTEFNNLVNGDYGHPLNALNFHGYMSWALGSISGYNAYSGQEALRVKMDDLQQWLVVYCGDNPKQSFGSAVATFIQTRNDG